MTITENRKPLKDFKQDSDVIRFVHGAIQRIWETDQGPCLVYSFHHLYLYPTVFTLHL